MHDSEIDQFSALLTDVLSYYGKDTSRFVLGVYWDSLKRFDLDAIKRAFSVHAQDADRGQFAPKPADIVRLLEGGSGDKAMQAWSKVERAIRTIGSYESVVFDDPIIHAVITDMGGWIELGKVTEKELPFRAKEFEQRYRGYVMRRVIPEHVRSLTGLVAADQQKHGHAPGNPVLVGNRRQALQVYQQGNESSGSEITRLNQPMDRVVAGLLDHKDKQGVA